MLFTRTICLSRLLFQNKAMYISLRIYVMILRAISHGLRDGSNLLVVFYWTYFKGYESDPWSKTQVETSLESSLVGVYGERVLESQEKLLSWRCLGLTDCRVCPLHGTAPPGGFLLGGFLKDKWSHAFFEHPEDISLCFKKIVQPQTQATHFASEEVEVGAPHDTPRAIPQENCFCFFFWNIPS